MHLIHRYRTVGMLGYRRYQECSVCGKRRYTGGPGRSARGTQPVDFSWIEHKADDLQRLLYPPPGSKQAADLGYKDLPKGPKVSVVVSPGIARREPTE